MSKWREYLEREKGVTPGPFTVARYRKNKDKPPTAEEIKHWLCELVDKTFAHGADEEFYFLTPDPDAEDFVAVGMTGNGPTSKTNAFFFAQSRTLGPEAARIAVAVEEWLAHYDSIGTTTANDTLRAILEGEGPK